VGRLLAQNHRRYGGLVVHLGVVLVTIGVATSTVGKMEREVTLKRGETLELGRYVGRFTGLSAGEEATHLLVQAALEVTEAGRPAGTLQPGQRLYPGSSSPFASVAVRYGFFRDFYVILGAFDRQGEWAQIKAQVHPMIAWIWLGGLVVLLGGVLALWPGGRRAPSTVRVAAGAAIAGGGPEPPRD
jgi:cytochrome c-type biogenesis protein CcmF